MMRLLLIGAFLISVHVGTLYAGRGDKLIEKELLKRKTTQPSKHKQMLRIPRHHKWRLNYADEDNHDDFTTTIPPTTTSTKSPEQIQKEKEDERRRLNPKGFLVGKKNKEIREEIFGTGVSVDKQVKNMENLLKHLETSCNSNADCTNKTCCLIGATGSGKCILFPHKIGQTCTQQCPCIDNLLCVSLKDKHMKTSSQQCVKKPPVTTTPEPQTSIEELVRRLREAKKKLGGDNKRAARAQLRIAQSQLKAAQAQLKAAQSQLNKKLFQ